MAFKEVNELRKAGRLEEALKLALKDYEEAQAPLVMNLESPQGDKNKENITANLLWPKRALAWVYYEYLKKNAQPATFDAFRDNLTKIKELQLPEDEKMVFDNCAWQIGSMIFALQKKEPVDYKKINEVFEIIREFHFTKPSESYSFLYKAFHKGYQNWPAYLEFADWWGFEYFNHEDYLKDDYNGKKIMAIAEQAYIAYSKKLLEGKPVDNFGHQRAVDKDKILSFLPLLDEIIGNHPEYQYPPYFKARLLLVTGSEENVISAFLPFAKQKRNDFWVWELMAEIFPEDKDIQFACFCKALSLKTPEDFLVKIRELFAAMLIERKMYPEAKVEIEKVIATRTKHEWKLSPRIKQWIEKDWYKTETNQRDNSTLYLKYAQTAEEILFQDIPEVIVVVEFVNTSKLMVSFVQNKGMNGFFKYAGLLNKPQIGDVLKVRFSDFQQDGFCKVVTAKVCEPDTPNEAIKPFEGEIKIIKPHNIGFVEDIFIEPGLIQKYNLSEKQPIKGKAILSFNKKKNEWGWKAYMLSQQSNSAIV